MTKCPKCGFDLSRHPLANGECPGCGAWLTEEGVLSTSLAAPDESHVIGRYFRELKLLLTHPSRFFSLAPVSGGLGAPLAFGLVSHWLGAALAYLWAAAWHVRSTSYLGQMADQMAGWLGHGPEIESLGRHARWLQAKDTFSEWMTGAASIVADPFITLLWLFVGAFFLFVAARLFVGAIRGMAQRPARLPGVTFESAVRIAAFSLGASVLQVIPFGGAIFASIAGFCLMVVGTREFYSVSSLRSVVIVLFPKILVVGLFFLAFLATVVGLIAFFVSQ